MTRAPTLIFQPPAHQSIAVHQHVRADFPAAPRGPIVHDHQVLVAHLSGTTHLWMGRELVLRRGDVLLVPEGMPHLTSGPFDSEILGVAVCTGCMQGAWGALLREAFDEVRQGGVQPASVARSLRYLQRGDLRHGPAFVSEVLERA